MFAVAVIENSLWLLLHEEQFKSGIRHLNKYFERSEHKSDDYTNYYPVDSFMELKYIGIQIRTFLDILSQLLKRDVKTEKITNCFTIEGVLKHMFLMVQLLL